jgi:hypothetical protein
MGSQVLRNDNGWAKVEMQQIIRGHRFRLVVYDGGTGSGGVIMGGHNGDATDNRRTQVWKRWIKGAKVLVRL